jgi:hypothetical protein
MSARINVRTFCDPVELMNHTAVLASLPATYALNEDGATDIALVGADRAGIAAGRHSNPAAMVIANAARLSLADAELLAKDGIPAFPALRLSSLLSTIRPRSVLNQASLIRSHLTWQGDWTAAVVEHLAGLEAVCGPLADVRLLSTSPSGYAGGTVTKTGVKVLWTGVSGNATSFYELDIIGIGERLEVATTLDRSARPALVRFGSAQGIIQPHGTYEDPLRLFWRSFAADQSGASAAASMDRLVRVLDLVATLPRPSLSRSG